MNVKAKHVTSQGLSARFCFILHSYGFTTPRARDA
jgi:hypothetical protein